MIKIKPMVIVPLSELERPIMERLERCARICYKSEDKMGAQYNPRFLKDKVARGHESIIEHEKITVMFIVDRGISHEIVRHRIGSYSQESTRYCNYSKEKFGNEITVIEPYYYLDDHHAYQLWEESCLAAEKAYMSLLESGSSPQEARGILPTCLKTELAVTYNLREWRHFFRQRCDFAAHPQMRQAAIPLLLLFKEKLPVLFEDIPYDQSFPAQHFAAVHLSDDLFNY